jgi:hypothetical protein
MAASPAGELPSFGRGTTSGRLRHCESYNSQELIIVLTGRRATYPKVTVGADHSGKYVFKVPIVA